MQAGKLGGSMARLVDHLLQPQLPWRMLLAAAIVGAIFAFIGARSVTLIDPALLKPIILLLLIAVAIYTFMRKDFGHLHAPKWPEPKQRWIAMGIGAVLGFYEGFFGPGTGSFLIFAFVGLLGFNFLTASASAKVINITTNLAALAWFAWSGNILYKLAIPMAVFNVAGALVGSRLAIKKGSGFLRVFFLVVMVALILRYAYDIFWEAS